MRGVRRRDAVLAEAKRFKTRADSINSRVHWNSNHSKPGAVGRQGFRQGYNPLQKTIVSGTAYIKSGQQCGEDKLGRAKRCSIPYYYSPPQPNQLPLVNLKVSLYAVVNNLQLVDAAKRLIAVKTPAGKSLEIAFTSTSPKAYLFASDSPSITVFEKTLSANPLT